MNLLEYSHINGRRIEDVIVVIPEKYKLGYKFLVRPVTETLDIFAMDYYGSEKLNIVTSGSIIQAVNEQYVDLYTYFSLSRNRYNTYRVFKKFISTIFDIGLNYRIYTGDFLFFFVNVTASDVKIAMYDYENFNLSDEVQMHNLINIIGKVRRNEILYSIANAFDFATAKITGENTYLRSDQSIVQYLSSFRERLQQMYIDYNGSESDGISSSNEFVDRFSRLLDIEFPIF
jgi:hypothetical protein